MDKTKVNIMNLRLIMGVMLLAALFVACEDPARNIAGVTTDPGGGTTPTPATEVVPVDINSEGFDLLENMQGQWVGINRVIADDYPWFGFDYRAISPSQIHGIFEGGTQGNLLTSFFVTEYKGKRTIMARNGGLLNGIYRTSYFVMDSVAYTNNDAWYRLVDAVGGRKVMSMELRFTQDSLYWNAYTSRLGLAPFATRHMTFKAVRNNSSLAETAAAAVGYPQNVIQHNFADGFKEEWLQAAEGAKSATFLAQDPEKDVFTLAQESGDPYTISQHPYLAYLQIDIEKNDAIAGADIQLYLSKDPLTDESGYFTTNVDAYNSILLFPYLIKEQNQFLVTYLHPGDYYVTAIADMDGDLAPSQGDITHQQLKITVAPEEQKQITITGINVQN